MNAAKILQLVKQPAARKPWIYNLEEKALVTNDEQPSQINRWLPSAGALETTDDMLNSVGNQGFSGCRLVVIYDGQDARHRAGRLFEKLRLIFGEEIDFKESWWSFSVLKSEAIAELAAQEAVEADVILFVFGTGHELPKEIARFNKQWPARRQGRPGLLAVLSQRPDHRIYEANALENHFGELAQKAGVDFLSNLIAHPLQGSVGKLDDNRNADKVIQPLVDEYFSPSVED